MLKQKHRQTLYNRDYSSLSCIFFVWNRNNNLEGYEKGSEKHKFTWQPSGSQFTIIEEIPEDKWQIRIKRPELVDKETILKGCRFR